MDICLFESKTPLPDSAAVDRLSRLSLSTDDVAPVHRQVYWRERFGPVWGDIDIVPLHGAPFFARLRSTRFGELRFNQVQFAGHRMSRSRRPDDAFYSLAFPVAGRALTSLGTTTVTLEPGNVYLLDNGVDGDLTPLPDYSTFNVQIPSRLIDPRLRQHRTVFSAPLHKSGGRALMLYRYIRNLHRSLEHLDDADAGFYARQVCDLIGFLMAGEGAVCESDSSTVAAHRRNVLAFIEQHYADEHLTPARIAAGCGMSERYLYRIVRGSGQTVMEHVQHIRLAHARVSLENPLLRGLSVAEIGYRSGFASASEFSRAFKREFGQPPSQFLKSQHVR